MWKREFLAAMYHEVRQGTSVPGSGSLARVGRGVRERARCLCTEGGCKDHAANTHGMFKTNKHKINI